MEKEKTRLVNLTQKLFRQPLDITFNVAYLGETSTEILHNSQIDSQEEKILVIKIWFDEKETLVFDVAPVSSSTIYRKGIDVIELGNRYKMNMSYFLRNVRAAINYRLIHYGGIRVAFGVRLLSTGKHFYGVERRLHRWQSMNLF